MRKTFKSAAGGFNIGIHPVEDGVQFRITNMRGNYQQFTTSANDAAEQALAILEAAGFDGDENMFTGLAVANLRDHVEEQERATAEAEAQAKLEAEALELFKASGAYGSDRIHLKFIDLDDHIQKAWLAVARRAREINKEEGQ